MRRSYEVMADVAQALMSIGKAAKQAEEIGYHQEAHRLRMEYHTLSDLYKSLGETMGKQSDGRPVKT